MLALSTSWLTTNDGGTAGRKSRPALSPKEGKENNQAVAYLDDGTMIVVEEGKRFIGKKIKVLVTSVLQTSAGRMIFGKPAGGRQDRG